MKRTAPDTECEDDKKPKMDTQAVGTEVHVSSLAWEVAETHIRDFFGFAGEILRVKLLTWDEGDFAGRSKGRAFVKFNTPAAAAAAATKNQTEMMGRKIGVVVVDPAKGNNKHEVYVSGLPAGATEVQVMEFFAPTHVVSLNLLSKGQAFVQFSTSGALEQALTCNDKQLLGSTIKVAKAGLQAENSTSEPAAPKAKTKNVVRAESRAFCTDAAEGEAWERVVLVLRDSQGVSQGAKEGDSCTCTAQVGAESFSFEVSANEQNSGTRVTVGFIEGTSDGVRKEFWKLYERIVQDVQRTSRKWRRKMKQQSSNKTEV